VLLSYGVVVGEENCRSLGFARDDKGEGDALLCIVCWTSEQQVALLRYAPIGMTKKWGAQQGLIIQQALSMEVLRPPLSSRAQPRDLQFREPFLEMCF